MKKPLDTNNPLINVAIARFKNPLNESIELVNDLYIYGSINIDGVASILENKINDLDSRYKNQYLLAKSRYNSLCNMGISTAISDILESKLADKVKDISEFRNITNGNRPDYIIYGKFLDLCEKYSIYSDVSEISMPVVNAINENKVLLDIIDAVGMEEVAPHLYENNMIKSMLNNGSNEMLSVLESHGIKRAINVYNRMSPVMETKSGGILFMIENRIFEANGDSIRMLPFGTYIPESYIAACQLFSEQFDIKTSSIIINEENNVRYDLKENRVHSGNSMVPMNEGGLETIAMYTNTNFANGIKDMLENLGIEAVSKTILINEMSVDIMKIKSKYYISESVGSAHNSLLGPMSESDMRRSLNDMYGIDEETIEPENDIIQDVEYGDEIVDSEIQQQIDDTISDLQNEMEDIDNSLEDIDNSYMDDNEMVFEAKSALIDRRDVILRDIAKLNIAKNMGNSRLSESLYENIIKAGDKTSFNSSIGEITMKATAGGVSVILERYDAGMKNLGISKYNSVPTIEAAKILIESIVDTMENEGLDTESVCIEYLELLDTMSESEAIDAICAEYDISPEYLQSCLGEYDLEEGKLGDAAKKLRDKAKGIKPGLMNLDKKLDSLLSSKNLEVKTGKYAGKVYENLGYDKVQGGFIGKSKTGTVLIDPSWL